MSADSQKIPDGYKQTEIGVIPEDWEIKRLGDIGESIIGLTYTPNDVEEYGKLVHRSSNIQDNRLSYEDNVYVNLSINEKLILKDGDILICVRNGSRDLIGKSALIKGKSIGDTFGAFMSVYRTENNQKYIFYLILSDIIQKQINQSLGATINQITNKTLNNFQIPYPNNPHEQESIASVLSDTDVLIEKLEKLINKKKAIKQGVMQQLLTGKKRLPGFEVKQGYKVTEIGVIPEDWEVVELGSLGTFSKGSGIKRSDSSSGKIPAVRYGELYTYHENVINKFYSFISPNIAEGSKKIRTGDILFAGSGETKEEIGKCAAYVQDVVAYAGGDIVIFSPTSENSTYLGYLLNSSVIAKQKASKAQGDAVVHIYSNALSRIQVPKPQIKEQAAIATVLSEMDAEIEALKEKLEKYKQIKAGMMQQLLTGKIRIIN